MILSKFESKEGNKHFYLPNKIFTKKNQQNDRYANLLHNPNNYNKPNISNNNLSYEPMNKKEYNRNVDPNLSNNNKLLIIKESSIYPNLNSKKISLIKKSLYNRNLNTKTDYGKDSTQEITFNSKNKLLFNNKKSLNTESKIVFTSNFPDKKFFKWKNIGFKEVKYKSNILFHIEIVL